MAIGVGVDIDGGGGVLRQGRCGSGDHEAAPSSEFPEPTANEQTTEHTTDLLGLSGLFLSD
jgi:hypothetical protein